MIPNSLALFINSKYCLPKVLNILLIQMGVLKIIYFCTVLIKGDNQP